MEGERSLPEFEIVKPDEDDVMCISYTSGTTGNPKGVKVSHKAVVTYIMVSSMHPSSSKRETDTTLSFLPAAHIYE